MLASTFKIQRIIVLLGGAGSLGILLVSILAVFLEALNIFFFYLLMRILLTDSTVFSNNIFLIQYFKEVDLGLLVFCFVGTLFLVQLARICTLYQITAFGLSFEHKIAKSVLLKFFKDEMVEDEVDRITVTKSVLNEANQFVHQSLIPFLQLISHSIFIVIIGFVLLMINPASFLISGVVLCACYFVVSFFSRNVIKRFGEKRFKLNSDRFKQTLDLIRIRREALLYDRIDRAMARFNMSSSGFATAQTIPNVIGQSPKYLVEFVLFTSLGFGLLFHKEGTVDIFELNIPVLLFAFMRVAPSAQIINLCINQLKFNEKITISIFDLVAEQQVKRTKPTTNPVLKSIGFVGEVRFDKLSIKYDHRVIPLDGHVLIHGASGCGKSTFFDLLIGYKISASGKFFINNDEISQSDWRLFTEYFAMVPQSVELIDGSVEDNILFYGEYDERSMIECLRLTNLSADFNSTIDYIRMLDASTLSGGQKQRVGIARAIYQKRALVLVDEGFNSIDQNNISYIFQRINELKSPPKLLVISHDRQIANFCSTAINFNTDSKNVL